VDWGAFYPPAAGIRVKVMSTIALHSPRNSRKPLEIEAWFQRNTIRNGLWGIEWSRHVTWPTMLTTRYQ